jgi:hypothetical protein
VPSENVDVAEELRLVVGPQRWHDERYAEIPRGEVQTMINGVAARGTEDKARAPQQGAKFLVREFFNVSPYPADRLKCRDLAADLSRERV